MAHKCGHAHVNQRKILSSSWAFSASSFAAYILIGDEFIRTNRVLMDEAKSKVWGTITGMWWICWFGFIGAFLWIGIDECRWEFSRKAAALPFSATLLLVIPASWVAFFVADSVSKERTPTVVRLLTIMGTVLAAVTLLAVFFFTYVAPRVS
jgi:hypothetical protein